LNRTVLSTLVIAITISGLALTAFSPFSLAQTAKATELWQFKTAYSKFTAPPVAVDGLVYVTSSIDEGPPTTLYCVNAATGHQVWSSTGLFDYFTVVDGYIYIGSGSSVSSSYQGVACRNARNGAVIWNYSAGDGAGTFGKPTVANGVVYVGGNDYTLSTSSNEGFIGREVMGVLCTRSSPF